MKDITPIPAADLKVGDVIESWGFEYPVVEVKRYTVASVGITVKTGDRSTHLQSFPAKACLRLVVQDGE
jgi:hypothetical protein